MLAFLADSLQAHRKWHFS